MEADLTRRAMAMDQATDTIVITDTFGTITYVNPAFEKSTGYTRKEAIGENPRVLKSGKQDEAFYRHLWQTISGGKTWSGRFINLKKDGSQYTEEATISPVFSPSGEIVNYVAVKRDITDKISLENQLRQAQKMEAIGTLAGGIAHDFNNILGVIMGRAELSQFDISESNPAYQNIIEVLEAGNRAKDLVKQILAFSRHSEHERKLIQPGSIIKEALKMLRASLPSTIEIQQNITAESGVIMADPTQIHQIMMNLCTNAYHAMEKTGGVLSVSLAEMEYEASGMGKDTELPPGKYLQLTVSDTGQGMESHVMERIFDPYFTTKKPGEGTGLGLAVVHGIVKGHGGSISVESEVGEGTTFQILLPRIEHTKKMAESEEPGLIPEGNERILLVDDDESLAETGKEMLEHLGYKVVIRTSSIEALKLFSSQPDKFDLVITDHTMPKMTGVDLAKELMQIRPDIPVILCTGYSKLITKEKIRKIGIKEFVMKPIVMRDIAETIRKVLGD
jgi:PAS domain S-box-containing protein